MRVTYSHSCESLRSLPRHYWPHHPGPYFRPSLNIRRLVRLLQIAAADYEPVKTADKGKKRASSQSPTPTGRASKRVKTTGGDSTADRGDSSEIEITNEDKLEPWPAVVTEYPDFHSLEPQAPKTKINHSIPVYRHVTEVQYTTAVPTPLGFHADIDVANGLRWLGEERILIKALESFGRARSEPERIELGKIYLAVHHGRLVATSRELSSVDRWLLLVPSFDQDLEVASLDYTSNAVGDLLMACHVLKMAGRAEIEAHLSLILLPPSAYDEAQHELPFHLQIETNITLLVPAIFEPAPRNENKKQIIAVEDAQRRFLNFVYPANISPPDSFDGVTNIPFFYSVLGPAPQLQSKLAEEAMQHEALLPTLLPFQRRSVGWMLDREGMVVTSTGNIVPKTPNTGTHSLPPFWDKVEEGNQTWYLHHLSGMLSPHPPLEDRALGGILAEEPGLGKTLETISLVLLNPAPHRNPTNKRWDPEARLEVKEIKTTLIVTPSALASQWADELTLHAPTLKVLIYEGWAKVKVPITAGDVEAERVKRLLAKKKGKAKATLKKAAKGRKGKGKARVIVDDSDSNIEDEEGNEEILDWCSYVNTSDVVITTYQVLRHDFNVARATPIRPRREDVVYSNVERPRSPLVMCEWLRVVMDEVQMVGGGKTEDMVSLIPRLSSFAVSGTPARAQVSDLMHVLKFLRVGGYVGSPRLWNRLLKPGFAGEFASFFRQYAIRTMKSSVKDELTIPQQTRFLVSIDMGRVERHVYDQSLETTLLELGLDARGVAASAGWQVDGALLRSSLRRLRGICTHPQVGQLQKAGDKLYKPGALKTMEAVLESMRDQNWRNMMDDCKAKVQSLVRCAQLQQHDHATRNRYQQALETLLLAEKDAKQLIQDVKAAMAVHEEKGGALKKEAAELREARILASNTDVEEPSSDKGKGKEREVSTPVSGRDDSEDGDLPRTPAGEEHAVKRRALQQRLRECNVTLHRVKFLQGDVYHVLGASHSPAEDAAYNEAEEIRRALLKTTEVDAKRAMAQLTDDAVAKGLTQGALLIELPYLDQGGIRSSELMDEANEIIEEILNEQAVLLWKWRSHINGLLTQNLSAGDDQADGQEYQRALDDQGEAETYLQAYSALLADRREALVNERTLLAAHDAREKRLRHTKAAIKAAAAAAEAHLMIPDGIDLQPEHEVLHKELSDQRKELLHQLQGRAIKSILIDLNGVAGRIQKDLDPEKTIVKEALAALRRLISDQGILMDKLDADLALIRKAFNQRILYFRQLQEISDSVAEVTWETTLAEAIHGCKIEQNDLSAKINTNRARQRYLDHLAKNRDDGTMDDDDETCILCRCEFTRGFITQCAHIFCEGCLKAWLLRKEGKTCPVCRVAIVPDQMQRFTVNEPESQPPPKPINGEPAPRSRRQITYNMIDPKLFAEIQTMESFGDFGNKIQALVRHLLYLQMTEPGAKSIVFSAWADSLHIMERALIDNGIRCLRIDQNSHGEGAAKKFRTNPEILVLLLHGERENAGLNVTCASRVFLLESVVHHGFEIQAIARIDRMGQTRSTEVYCYYAEDTVEKNIIDLAARQGLSLYTKDNSAGTLNVSSFVMDAEKTAVEAPVKKVQKGDFIFKIDDMLAILFPHMYEDVEYLLPAEEDAVMVDEPSSSSPNGGSDNPRASSRGGQAVNAVAGPSRLS